MYWIIWFINVFRKRTIKRNFIWICIFDLFDKYFVTKIYQTIKRLNKRYRGLDEITDVLSFSDKYQGQYYGGDTSDILSDEEIDFIFPQDLNSQLGELVISIPQAMRQTKYDLESELVKLVAHGFLHLLGYDHELPDDRIIMEKLESEAINEVSDIVWSSL